MPERARPVAHPIIASGADLVPAKTSTTNRPRNVLPQVEEVLAVCAHPDDESFGHRARVRVLCFTHGEASTLGDTDRPLGEVRAEELNAAAGALGIDEVTLLSYPDGCLDEVHLEELAALVEKKAAGAGLLLAFDEGGITGHPDHIRATQAALAFASSRGLPVLGWALPEAVAARLNTELGAGFMGRPPEELDFAVKVDRARQREAIARHASQSGENPVLWRRLELDDTSEHLRWLARRPSESSPRAEA